MFRLLMLLLVGAISYTIGKCYPLNRYTWLTIKSISNFMISFLLRNSKHKHNQIGFGIFAVVGKDYKRRMDVI